MQFRDRSVFIFMVLLSFLIAAPLFAQGNPSLGVAKNGVAIGRQIILDFYLENLGDEDLFDLELTDDLDAVFGAGNYSVVSPPDLIDNPGTINLNAGFDGSGDTMIIGPGSSLIIGDTAHIQVTIEILMPTDQGNGLGVYINQVMVSSITIGEMPANDLSDHGTDPDPNGNGDPGDAGEDDPTIIDIFEVPRIGVAKNATLNGTLVTLDFYLENFGNRTLNSLLLPDNLDAVFGAGNYNINSGPTLIDDPGTLTVNAGFNGSGDTALISSGSLAVGDTAQIRVVVDVTTITDRGNGFGVYANQVTASGRSPALALTSDLSDSGTNPDPDGDNDPTDPDEDDPTVFILGQEPVIGVAKNATVNGAQVTLDFYLENHGNVDLINLSLPDNLATVFGAGNFLIAAAPSLIDDPGTITLNPAFNGNGNTALITSGSLAIGDTAQIRVVVTVTALSDQGLGTGNYRNRVTATAQDADGGVTSDISDHGTDPDPNGNDDPTEAGENDPTDFTVGEVAVIGIAKRVRVLAATSATIDVAGTPMPGFGPRVVITWYLHNLGNVPLSNLTLTDDLDAVFGAGNYGTILSAAFPEIVASDGGLVRNTNYNGANQPEVLLAGSTIPAGSIAIIRTEVIVTNVTDQGMGVGVYENQATSMGDAPGGAMVSDLSHRGVEPDPNGNGDPTEAGENDPTPFIIGSFIGVAKNATVNIDEVTIDLYLENFGVANLTDLSLTDNLASTLGEGNFIVSSAPVLIDDPGTLSLNAGFDGSGDQELLAPGGSLAGGDTAQIQFVITIIKLINRGNGLGVYSNSATASGEQAGGVGVFDSSETGVDPDPNGNGDPTEFGENDPTVYTIVTDAVVGAAKDVTVSGNQITFDIYLENLGTMTSTGLTLSDDLDAVFGAGNYVISVPPVLIDDPGAFSLNGGYNGGADTALLTPGGSLNAGDTAQIQFVVDVTNIVDQGFGLRVYQNQATVTGMDSNGLIVCDLSDAGVEPDADGDNDPTFPGLADPPVPGEDDPNIFFIGVASIGAAYHSFVNGNRITYDYYLENLGDVAISGISVAQNLFSVFGFGNFTVFQPPILLEGPGTLSLNASFDGTFSQALIFDGSLAPGQSARIRFGVEVTNVTDQGNGVGVYHTQFTVFGSDPIGDSVSDMSDDGIDPDPNGNGDANEAGENDPTVSIIGEESTIGVAKNATLLGNQVTFDYYLENLGNVVLSNIVMSDSLDEVFGAGNYTITTPPTFIDDPGTLALDPAYNGSGAIDLFLAGGTLAVADTAQIQIVVTVDTIVDQGLGAGAYRNQVMVSATGPSATVAEDLSDNGTDPDPNGNGNPADVGESDPTTFVVTTAAVGAAKTAVVAGAVVTLDFYIENLGNTVLSNISMSDDLDALFGAGNYVLVSGPTTVGGPRDLVLNAGFNGGADTELIDSGTIARNVTERFRVVVRVLRLIDAGAGLGVYANQVTVNAEDPIGAPVSDLSDNGANPDPNGNNEPDDAGEDDPTVFTVAQAPIIGAAKTASVNTRSVTLNFYLENFSNTSLINLSLIENLNGLFGAGNYSITTAPMLIVDPGTIVLNAGYNGGAAPNILDSSSTLAFGATAQIRMVVEVTTVTDQGLGLGVYSNQVTASAASPNGSPTSDLSDNGTDPDPNGNGNPAETGENDATPIVLQGTIGDFVWNDLNGDGVQDMGEPGLAGITVYLDSNNNGVLDGGEPSAITGGLGAYDFIALAAGSYTVRVDAATVPAGFVLITANNPLAVTLFAGEDFNAADFGYQQQDAAIGDFVWNDLNGDGVQDMGEPGLAGVTVFLDLNTNGVLDGGEPFDISNGMGAYDITDLATGTYSVRTDPATVPVGFILTGGPMPQTVPLAAGQDFNDADFGYQQQDAAIGDFVWNDLNGDGVQDPGEAGLSGVAVYLDLNSNGVLDGGEPSDITDGMGGYDITDLATGTYNVRTDPATVPVGFALTGGTIPRSVPLAAGEDFNDADFGYQQQDAMIGDFVWNDLNGDGVPDPGEPGLAGVTVYLDLNANGVFDGGEPSDATDGTGLYDIENLALGTYNVRTDPTTLPSGFNLTGGTIPHSATIVAGEDYDDADFGYQQQNAEIGDFVWEDLNGDGIQDPGEPGIENVTVDLVQLDAPGGFESVLIDSEVTDDMGRYRFTGLPIGSYFVAVTDENAVITGFILTVGVNPRQVILTAGQVEETIDFGYCLPAEITEQPLNADLCEGDQLSLNVAVDGSGIIDLQWRKDGVDIPGEDQDSFTINSVGVGDAGVYDCVVSNGCGSVTSLGASVTVSVYGVTVNADVVAQGLFPLTLQADIACPVPPISLSWRDLNTLVIFGVNENPVTLDSILSETTVFEVTVNDNSDAPVTDTVLALVSADPIYFDLNGDGCNDANDLLALAELWLQTVSDPNGDNFIDIRDFLYINIDGDCLEP